MCGAVATCASLALEQTQLGLATASVMYTTSATPISKCPSAALQERHIQHPHLHPQAHPCTCLQKLCSTPCACFTRPRVGCGLGYSNHLVRYSVLCSSPGGASPLLQTFFLYTTFTMYCTVTHLTLTLILSNCPTPPTRCGITADSGLFWLGVYVCTTYGHRFL